MAKLVTFDNLTINVNKIEKIELKNNIVEIIYRDPYTGELEKKVTNGKSEIGAKRIYDSILASL